MCKPLEHCFGRHEGTLFNSLLSIFSRGRISATTLRWTRYSASNKPRAILHFAAESHVDRSIQGPAEFVQTNVVGTFTLLEAALAY